MEVNVVEDENAYLGLKEDSDDGVVRIKNQFAGDLELTVTAALASGNGAVEVEEDSGDIEIDIEPDNREEGGNSSPDNSADITIPLGNIADVTADVTSTCHGAGTVSLELTFSGAVSDTGTTVDKTRTFSIEYEPEDDATDQVTKVKFPGSSNNVKILTTQSNGSGGGHNGEVTAKLYCENGEGVRSSSDYECVPVDEAVDETNFGGDCEGSIVGVGIRDIGVFEKSDRGNGNTVDEEAARDAPSWE
ncbi:hypothetical protein [Halorubrum salsamenti]|uniref:hypothetical protein n=1 Tax=Halorubrum salsamenti TaxID=2583990 RepID=UPI0011A35E01|nr:hypothetical protein [Halorubrum salsamenti]